METLKPKEFNIKNLIGISDKNIEEHLKLYKAYVTNANLVLSKIEELCKDIEANSYLLGELYRRFSFEFNGVRNHEYFFKSLLGGSKEINKEGELYKKIENKWSSFDNFLAQFKKLAMTRGIGWAMLSYDKETDNLFISWIDEQHLGQLNNTSPILLLDMWEHAYVYDYPTSQKKEYVESFFKNINWEVIEHNYQLLITND